MEFMLSFLNIIDLLGILPFYFSLTLNIISSEYSIGRTGDSFTIKFIILNYKKTHETSGNGCRQSKSPIV
jgi:hypothetical protein